MKFSLPVRQLVPRLSFAEVSKRGKGVDGLLGILFCCARINGSVWIHGIAYANHNQSSGRSQEACLGRD